MRLTIVHETRYSYEEPARGLIQLLRLTPLDHDGQQILRWHVDPGAEGRLTAGSDGFGNVVHTFAADEPLSSLVVTARGEVRTTDTAGIVRQTAEIVPDPFYLRSTALTAPDDDLVAFATEMAERDPEPLPRLHALLLAINDRVRFDTGTTDAGTSAGEAFRLGRGVCQDLTHIFLAVARHLGIPSRYVSGYFHRADGVTEQEAGHAWAEAKLPTLGWIGFDPTNGICTTEAHVRVAIGLDYLGAAPVRGSRRGGGREAMSVRLSVVSEVAAGSARKVQG